VAVRKGDKPERAWRMSGKEADAPSQFAIALLSNSLAALYSPFSPSYIWPLPYGSGLLHDIAPVYIIMRSFRLDNSYHQVRNLSAKVISSLVCRRDI
jgi:hypothetical protein